MIVEIIKPSEETANACFRSISPNYIHYTGEYDNFTVKCDNVTVDRYTNDVMITLNDGPVYLKIHIKGGEYESLKTRKWGA